MISKTIGLRGTNHFQTNPCSNKPVQAVSNTLVDQAKLAKLRATIVSEGTRGSGGGGGQQGFEALVFRRLAKLLRWILMGVSENSVPLNPMVNDHYPY